MTAAMPTAVSSSVDQLLSPIATVAAAIAGALITGFGAAGLKHRWDTRADEILWRRDRDSRVRAQQLEAFSRYLSTRPDLRAIRALTTAAADPAAVVSDARLAAANLLILLPDASHRGIVEQDLLALEEWLARWLDGHHAEVPSADRLLDLARSLVVEPAADPGQ